MPAHKQPTAASVDVHFRNNNK